MAHGAHERVSLWEEKWQSGENLTPDFPTPEGGVLLWLLVESPHIFNLQKFNSSHGQVRHLDCKRQKLTFVTLSRK